LSAAISARISRSARSSAFSRRRPGDAGAPDAYDAALALREMNDLREGRGVSD